LYFLKYSKFQHHTRLYSKCSTLLVSSLSLSPICWWKEHSFECSSCHGNPGLNLTCKSCIICYATQGVEIFPFSSCFWSIILCTGDCCLQITITLVFSTFISIP
jgi:hypothetical protein